MKKKDTQIITFQFTAEQEVITRNFSEYMLQEAPAGSFSISNEYLRVPWQMDLVEFKLLGHFLSKLKRRKDNRSIDGSLIVRTSLKEIIKSVNGEAENSKYYMKVAHGLIQKSVVEINNVVGAVIYNIDFNDLNSIEIRFNTAFSPFINGLAEHFTTIVLAYTYKFRSKYTYVLYTYLKSWESTGKPQILTTQQLKTLFNLSKDDYCSKDGKFYRTEFERKTLVVACKEINAHSDIMAGWGKFYEGQVEGQKGRRRVRGYIFETLPNARNKIEDGYQTSIYEFEVE